MNSKELKYNDDAQKLLQSGVDKLANAVKITLGPRGNNVMIQSNHVPHVTKDGVTVAKSIRLENEFEDMGCQVVKNAAARTAMDAGDGTTTATILTQSIITYGFRYLSSGANQTMMKKGIDKAVIAVVAKLKEMAKPVENVEQTCNVATISANNDAVLGELISGAMEKVGKDGVITVEPSRTTKTTVTTTDGAQYRNGWISPYFITNTKKFEAEYQDCLILCTDHTITSAENISEIVGQCHQAGSPLLIICNEMVGEAVQLLVTNKVKSGLKVVAVQGDGFGETRESTIKDMAIMTGAKFISVQAEDKLEKIELKDLGSAKKIIVGKSHTTIVNGGGNKTNINTRIEELRELAKSLKDSYEVEKVEQRLAKFTGGVGVISLGANSDIELREKADRVDDAICATKASLEEGIIIGGGTAYIKCIDCLDDLSYDTEDEKLGIDVIRKSLHDPLRQIAINAGDVPDMVIEKVKEKGNDIGYNAYSKKYVDMIVDGIIDPVKVTRTALENAASAATMLLSTKCIIVEIPDEFGGNKNIDMVM
jgi:chaperonin GroEL